MEYLKSEIDLVKDSIKNLKSYTSNSIDCSIKLNANEGKCKAYKDLINSVNIDMSLYPNDEYIELKNNIKKYLNVNTSNTVVGNGSSELVELIIKTFVDKGEKVLSFIPTFSMYQIYTNINSAEFIGVECNLDFSVNIERIIQKANEVKPKIIFLCNPNNPTGYLIKKYEIEKIIQNTNCIVVCDEAYIEFSDCRESMIDEISKYDRLIVLRTFSKAFSLAGLRVGYMVANQNLASIIESVRPPYNLNSICAHIATQALNNTNYVLDYVKLVRKQRNYIIDEFKKLNIKYYDSQANFIYFYSDIENLYEKLIDEDILIRNFGDFCRVTIGEEYENIAFIRAIKKILEMENL